MKIKSSRGKVIFDNGGGVLLQLPRFTHYYEDGVRAAKDLKNYVIEGNTNGWDGNQPEFKDIDPTGEEIRNGGYCEMMVADILKTATLNARYFQKNNVNC